VPATGEDLKPNLTETKRTKHIYLNTAFLLTPSPYSSILLLLSSSSYLQKANHPTNMAYNSAVEAFRDAEYPMMQGKAVPILSSDPRDEFL